MELVRTESPLTVTALLTQRSQRESYGVVSGASIQTDPPRRRGDVLLAHHVGSPFFSRLCSSPLGESAGRFMTPRDACSTKAARAAASSSLSSKEQPIPKSVNPSERRTLSRYAFHVRWRNAICSAASSAALWSGCVLSAICTYAALMSSCVVALRSMPSSPSSFRDGLLQRQRHGWSGNCT